MLYRFRAALLVVAVALGFSGSAGAYSYHNGLMVVVNQSGHQAWITTYNVFRHQINYGWANPVVVVYDNCCYVAGQWYYVRAEVKKVENGVMHQVADIDIKVQARFCADSHGVYGFGRVTLRQGPRGGFYFTNDADDRCSTSFF